MRMLRFSYGGAASHVGLVRDHNEDAAFAGPYLQLVADGVGGAAAGEVASATTTYVVSALAAADPDADGHELLAAAVARAHEELRRGTAEAPERAGMATTMTALLARADAVTLAHIGDSRAYLLRAGRLVRLSTDHTFVQMMLDEGRLSPEEAATHPYRNVVLNAVNGQDPPHPTVRPLDVRVGDRLLVCSDGLTDLVPDPSLAEILATADPDDAAADLVDAALREGGRDNVTCLVSDVGDGPEVCADGLLLGAMRDPRLVVDAGAIHV
jgi:serine/threonine protein phosphatase PrpC